MADDQPVDPARGPDDGRAPDGGAPTGDEPSDDAPPADAAPDGGPAEADAPGEPPEEHPSTDVSVELHVHFGMTGSFPLRVADLFFADDGLYVAEYAYITPFIGLAARKHRREAAAVQEVYDRYGLDAVLFRANSVVWHSYDDLDRVVVVEGGRLGRPKLAIYPETGPSHAFRFHDVPAFETAIADLDGCAAGHGFDVERESGLGFTPVESVKRFFWRPDR